MVKIDKVLLLVKVMIAIGMMANLENGFSVTVNNPMTENLNGGGWDINNVNNFVSKKISGIRHADQFSGADAGAKIAAAIADLPITGGTVDARGLEGTQTISTNPFFGVTKPVCLQLGASTYSLSVLLNISTPTSGQTVVEGLGDATVISLANTTAAIQHGSNTTIRSLRIESTLTTTINGAIFTQGTNNVSVENVVFSGGGHHIQYNNVSNFRILHTRHISITAPSNLIIVYQSNHGVIDNVRIEGFTYPTSTNSFGGIYVSESSEIDVIAPEIRDIDATTIPGFGGVRFSNSKNSNLLGGTVTGLKNGDAVVTEAGSTDINIIGSNLTGNNNTAGAGTYGNTGDGIDIFNSSRIRIVGCNGRNNGNLATARFQGIEIFTSSDVTVESCDFSDNGGPGVTVAGSPNVRLVSLTCNRNFKNGANIAGFGGVESSVEIIGGEYKDNGQGGGVTGTVEGIYLAGATTGVVQGVLATDTRTAGFKTQTYGIRIENTARAVLIGNITTGNLTGDMLDSPNKSPVLTDDGVGVGFRTQVNTSLFLDAGQGSGGVQFGLRPNSATGGVLFGSGGASPVVRAILNGDGNLGIGTMTPDSTLELSGASAAVSLNEDSATPVTPADGTEARIYVKADKLVIQWNQGGTVRYKYLLLSGTGTTWTHTTTAP